MGRESVIWLAALLLAGVLSADLPPGRTYSRAELIGAAHQHESGWRSGPVAHGVVNMDVNHITDAIKNELQRVSRTVERLKRNPFSDAAEEEDSDLNEDNEEHFRSGFLPEDSTDHSSSQSSSSSSASQPTSSASSTASSSSSPSTSSSSSPASSPSRDLFGSDSEPTSAHSVQWEKSTEHEKKAHFLAEAEPEISSDTDSDTVILFKGDKGEYCERYEQHFSFYCVGDVDQTQQARQVLEQFCPSYKKSCPDKAKGSSVPLTSWPANPFEKEVAIDRSPPRATADSGGDVDGEEEAEDDVPPLSKHDRYMLYLQRRVPCKPDCDSRIYPHCTEECKCDYIYPAVQKFCNPPPMPLFLNTCRLWYNGCPKYEQYHYASQYLYSKAEKGKVLPGVQPSNPNPYGIPQPGLGPRRNRARAVRTSRRAAKHASFVIPPELEPTRRKRHRSQLEAFADAQYEREDSIPTSQTHSADAQDTSPFGSVKALNRFEATEKESAKKEKQQRNTHFSRVFQRADRSPLV